MREKDRTMKNRLAVLAGAMLVLSTVIAPSLGASTASTKKVVRIDIQGVPRGGNPAGGGGSFTLRGAGVTDRGSESYSFAGAVGDVYLTGKKGDLVLRLKRRPSGLSVDSQGLDLWTGTWSTTSGGTRAFAALRGIGAFVGVIGPNYAVAFHLEGFVQTTS